MRRSGSLRSLLCLELPFKNKIKIMQIWLALNREKKKKKGKELRFLG